MEVLREAARGAEAVVDDAVLGVAQLVAGGVEAHHALARHRDVLVDAAQDEQVLGGAHLGGERGGGERPLLGPVVDEVVDGLGPGGIGVEARRASVRGGRRRRRGTRRCCPSRAAPTTRIGRGASSGRGTAWTKRTSSRRRERPQPAVGRGLLHLRVGPHRRRQQVPHAEEGRATTGPWRWPARARSVSPAGSATSMTLSTTSPRAGAAAKDETVRLQLGPCPCRSATMPSMPLAKRRSGRSRPGVGEAQRHAGGERVGQVGKHELLGVGDQVLPGPERFAGLQRRPGRRASSGRRRRRPRAGGSRCRWASPGSVRLGIDAVEEGAGLAQRGEQRGLVVVGVVRADRVVEAPVQLGVGLAGLGRRQVPFAGVVVARSRGGRPRPAAAYVAGSTTVMVSPAAGSLTTSTPLRITRWRTDSPSP